MVLAFTRAQTISSYRFKLSAYPRSLLVAGWVGSQLIYVIISLKKGRE